MSTVKRSNLDLDGDPHSDTRNAEQIPFPVPFNYNEFESESKTTPIAHYLWVINRNKWKILLFIASAIIVTIGVSSRITPVYEATATIDVDRQAPAAVIGQDSTRQAPNDADQFIATQIKMIQSDSVLRPVSERFKLINGEESVSKKTKIPTVREQNAPVALRQLKVSRPQNTYLLLISYRSTDAEKAAAIANAVAESYIQRSYDLRFKATASISSFMEKQLEELKAKMERSSSALAQFEKDFGVINPEEKTSILSARLLQLNTEFTNAQAERLKKQASYNSVKNGSIEAAVVSTQGEQLRHIMDRINEIRERNSTIGAQYGNNHPEKKKADTQLYELQSQFEGLKNDVIKRVSLEYKEAVNHESMLKDAVAEAKSEYDYLNSRSFEYKSLKQEAETDKGLYEELVRKIKEAGINSSFQDSSIRLADQARPGVHPVFPNIPLNAILAFTFSTLVGIFVAIVADTLDNTIHDPEAIQRELKTEVVGSLPLVQSWKGRVLPIPFTNSEASLEKGTSSHDQSSNFTEAVRTLRDSLLLSNPICRPKSLLITSAAPREGKTTTSVHLAVAHSLQKRKTLIIDADLRRPSIHEKFNLPNTSGISTITAGQAKWTEVIQKPLSYPDLDILTTGCSSRTAIDYLGFTLEGILLEAERMYDLIIIDSPPLLGFAEPLQLASIVDGVALVALAGQTNRNAVASGLNALKRLNANVIGIVLNQVKKEMSEHYYYYGYYGSYYSSHYSTVPKKA